MHVGSRMVFNMGLWTVKVNLVLSNLCMFKLQCIKCSQIYQYFKFNFHVFIIVIFWHWYGSINVYLNYVCFCIINLNWFLAGFYSHFNTHKYHPSPLPSPSKHKLICKLHNFMSLPYMDTGMIFGRNHFLSGRVSHVNDHYHSLDITTRC